MRDHTLLIELMKKHLSDVESLLDRLSDKGRPLNNQELQTVRASTLFYLEDLQNECKFMYLSGATEQMIKQSVEAQLQYMISLT